MSEPEEYDVVVIGSGAGGSTSIATWRRAVGGTPSSPIRPWRNGLNSLFGNLPSETDD